MMQRERAKERDGRREEDKIKREHNIAVHVVLRQGRSKLKSKPRKCAYRLRVHEIRKRVFLSRKQQTYIWGLFACAVGYS